MLTYLAENNNTESTKAVSDEDKCKECVFCKTLCLCMCLEDKFL